MRNIIILCATLVAFIGCSSPAVNPTIPQSADNDTGFPTYNINEDETNHQLSGSWELEFDLETLAFDIKPSRESSAHFNVTWLLPVPGIQVNSYDPVGEIIDVDVTINNSTPYTGYDLRLIIFTDDIGHKLLNADDWTGLFDIPGGMIINPFKAYAKSEPNRIFEGTTQHTENLLIHLPGGNPNVSFVIEASSPGNCDEPYEIDNFTQGVLTGQLGSTADVSVMVKDWQDDTNSVDLYCPQITGQTLVPFAQADPELWEMLLINDTAAIAGDYTGYIVATSSNSGFLALYDEVTITVSPGNVPSNPQIIGTSTSTARGVIYRDNYVYSAAYTNGFEVVNVTDPTLPEIIGSVPTGGWANDIEIQGNYAYIADVNDGLVVADISIPNDPTIVGSVPVMEAWRLAVDGDYLYLCWIGFAIFDISSPTSPQVIYAPPSGVVYFDVAKRGDFVYLAAGRGGLQIMNVSDPYNPYFIGNSSGISHADSLDLVGDYAYVINNRDEDTLYIVDISEPFFRTIVGTLDSINGTELKVSGGYAYIALLDGGLAVVDVSDPANPTLLSSLDTDGSSWDIALNENIAYLADETGGIKVIQLW